MNSNVLSLPVSIGEAIDKYSILTIKSQEIQDPIRLADVKLEMSALYSSLESIIESHKYHYDCLVFINKEIWNLSNQVRDPNISTEIKNTLFLETFLKNDARFRIKSKFNKLASSQLQEQKSYPESTLILKDINEKDNGYIRYLSLCYDTIILECQNPEITRIFANDPHILISNSNSDNAISLSELKVEPIPNLLTNYDWSFTPLKTLNYIVGGLIGDFIHCMYVIMCKYEATGYKGNLYITDDRNWGGDIFRRPIHQTYDELYDIVKAQSYIEKFSIYKNESIDINLNDWRKSSLLFGNSWLELLSHVYKTPLLEKTWITLDDSWTDPKYKDVILIHRANRRFVPGFIELIEPILKSNRCMFVTCDKGEYDVFPLKHLLPLDLKSTMKEMYIAINSCKFYIGNQSSPLAIRYSLFKPCLCELIAPIMYMNKQHYPDIYWFAPRNIHVTGMEKFTNAVNQEKDKKKKIAFVNHNISSCGVYQYGKRLGNILTNSDKFNVMYNEITSLDKYKTLQEDMSLDAIIYNYHPATLPWLNNHTICRRIPSIGIFHEGGLGIHFDHLIDISGNSQINSIPRPLFSYSNPESQKESEIPIIGSFGFGFNNKGFDTIVKYVNEQFDEAIIRLNITLPHFGDGTTATSIADKCHSIPRKEGIQLIVTHDFMDDTTLLNWLNENTINIFLYDMMIGRGPSSVIDYALSVNRPIGISDSYMFRHIYSDDICVYKTPIRDIISNGTKSLQKFKTQWSPDRLIEKVENFLISNVFKHDKINSEMNNVVLTDAYRESLRPTIVELFTLVPDMMSRKIARANVQQAFTFKYIKDNISKDAKLLCAGSHEDTCCAGLKVLGYDIVEIDPMYNSDLHTYCVNNKYPQVDCVFSVSVIEHVLKDDEFVDDMCKLLKPGGTCVFTCDFNNSYMPGDRVPGADHRFYTAHDLTVRFKKILDSNNCYIEGGIDYSAPPDFLYENTWYSFATMIFKKNSQ